MLGHQLAVLNVLHTVGRLGRGRLCSGPSLEQVHGEAQAEEEGQAGKGRSGHKRRGREAAGDLHLGNDEGRERDVGRQRGAVGVDEGLDFLSLLIAGLNLQRKRSFQCKTSAP